ncbi:hypothetical protein F6P94_14285 [Escherichia coli]|nr:hypothetical protein F6P94_14285 [Escherichia coli]
MVIVFKAREKCMGWRYQRFSWFNWFDAQNHIRMVVESFIDCAALFSTLLAQPTFMVSVFASNQRNIQPHMSAWLMIPLLPLPMLCVTVAAHGAS